MEIRKSHEVVFSGQETFRSISPYPRVGWIGERKEFRSQDVSVKRDVQDHAAYLPHCVQDAVIREPLGSNAVKAEFKSSLCSDT